MFVSVRRCLRICLCLTFRAVRTSRRSRILLKSCGSLTRASFFFSSTWLFTSCNRKNLYFFVDIFKFSGFQTSFFNAPPPPPLPPKNVPKQLEGKPASVASVVDAAQSVFPTWLLTALRVGESITLGGQKRRRFRSSLNNFANIRRRSRQQRWVTRSLPPHPVHPHLHLS